VVNAGISGSDIRDIMLEAVERRFGDHRAPLANRASLYANARSKNPERWTAKTRNWQPAGPVWLNPETEISVPEIRDAA
jgi:hypothetical protein